MIIHHSIPPTKKAFIEKVQSQIPVDLKIITNYLGVLVYYKEFLTKDIDGFLNYDPDTEAFEIHVNTKYLSKQHQRFTVAHEISHYILHKNYVIEKGSIDRSKSARENDKEYEADNLAVEILMPFDQINKYIDDGYNTISKLADIFDVTKEDMLRRFGKIIKK